MAHSAREQVIELIQSGDYEIAQIIGDGDQEEYQGCMGSLFMALEDDSTNVKLLDSKDPLCHKGSKTFMISYDSFFGDVRILIWEY